MNLVCIICSDGIAPSAEVYTTQCGHLFHFPCLIQWIERSKTCPQCRNKATEKTIHRIYLTVANSDGNGDDISTLQNKYDNLQFQLNLKEKDIRNFTEKYKKLKCQNTTLRTELVDLENKTRCHDSVVHALKDQISYFKSKARERDTLAEELGKLKTKLKQMESVELVVNSSREEVTEMLKNENDVTSLVILVATLKKALLDAERKKVNMEHKCKYLQNDITKYRKEITLLESSNQELRKEMHLTETNRGKQKDYLTKVPKKISHENSSNFESPVVSHSRSDDKKLPVESPTVEEKIADILQSDSPYLNVKRNITCIDVRPQKESKFISSSTGAKQISIFKRPIKVDKTKSCKPDGFVYNGLGGQCKEDLYPSPKAPTTGIKRHRIDSCMSSTKFRRMTPVLICKK